MLEYFRLTTGFEAKQHRIALPVPFSRLLLRWNQALKLLLVTEKCGMGEMKSDSDAPNFPASSCSMYKKRHWRSNWRIFWKTQLFLITQLLSPTWNPGAGNERQAIWQLLRAMWKKDPWPLPSMGSGRRSLQPWHVAEWRRIRFQRGVQILSPLVHSTPLRNLKHIGAKAISRFFDERAFNNPAKGVKRGLFLVAARSSDRFAPEMVHNYNWVEQWSILQPKIQTMNCCGGFLYLWVHMFDWRTSTTPSRETLSQANCTLTAIAWQDLNPSWSQLYDQKPLVLNFSRRVECKDA